MKKHQLASIALLAVAFFAIGCQKAIYLSDDNQVLSPQSGRGLVARPNSPIPDAPMAVGFVVVESKSRSFTSGSGRTVDHYYQGLASLNDTLIFYRSELAAKGWQRRAESNVGGQVASTYVKGRELLELSITTPRDVTSVRIMIRPSSVP